MSLIKFWKLDDNAPSTVGVATVGADGTYARNSSNTFTPSGPGTKIVASQTLNGSSDQMTFAGVSFASGAAFTVSAWVKYAAVGVLSPIVADSSNAWPLANGLADDTKISLRDDTISTIYYWDVPSLGTAWHNVVVTRDTSNHTRVFVDGVESTTGSQTVAALVDADTIGCRGGATFLSGQVAWVKIYDSDESAHIATLYAEKDYPKIVDPSNQAGTDYTSLSAWEAGEQTDLVAAGTIAIAECRTSSSTQDTTACTIAGWTTDGSHYPLIQSSGANRHFGAYDSTKYVLTNSGGTPLTASQDYTRVTGIQLILAGGSYGIYQGGFQVVIYSNIIKISSGSYGLYLPGGGGFVLNNLVLVEAASGTPIGIGANSSATIYSNTIVRVGSNTNAIGLYEPGGGSPDIYNNLVSGFGNSNSFIGTWDDADYNTTDSTQNPGIGSHNHVSQTFSFTAAGSGFYILSHSDTGATGQGLSALAPADDIRGKTRPAGTCSCGCFEQGTFTQTKIVDPSNQAGTDYTSLSNWEAGQQANLPALDTIEVAECRTSSSTADTAQCILSGWSTGAANYPVIQSTGSNRHNGVWDPTKYHLSSAGASFDGIISLSQDYVRVLGLQIEITGSGTGAVSCVADFAGGGGSRVGYCILKNSGTNGFFNRIIASYINNDGIRVFNSLLLFASSVATNGVCTFNGAAVAENNTLINLDGNPDSVGLTSYSGIGIEARNNLLYNFSHYNAYQRIFAPASDYNTTDTFKDVGDLCAAGHHGSVNQSFSFNDKANGDYSLAYNDAGARDRGSLLSAVTSGYTDDILGHARDNTGHVDCGCFEAISATVKVVDPSNQAGTDYTSLSAWEAAQQADLVAGNRFEVAECRTSSSTADTTAIRVSGWTTDLRRYPVIQSTGSHRHTGKWDATKYNLSVPNTHALVLGQTGARTSGLQAAVTGTSFNLVTVWPAGDTTISDCILRQSSTSGGNGVVIYGATTDDRARIFNNLILVDTPSAAAGIGIYCAGSTMLVENNTIINTSGDSTNLGMGWNDGHITARNNLLSGFSNTLTYDGNFQAGTDYNTTDSSDSIGTGSNNHVSQTFTFTNAGSGDYSLTTGDTGARNKGTVRLSLTVGPGDDILGTMRESVGHVDCGCFEQATVVITTKTVDVGGTGDYTSLSAWEAGQQGDLVATRSVQIAECKASNATADTTLCYVSGWTTGPTHYPKIQSTGANKHTGVWNSSKYTIVLGTFHPILIDTNYTQIDGIQARVTGTSAYAAIAIDSTSFYTVVKNCLLDVTTTGDGGSGIYASSLSNLFNNLITVSCTSGAINGIEADVGNTTCIAENNTIIRVSSNTSSGGMWAANGAFVARNNLVYNFGNSNSFGGFFARGASFNTTDSTQAPTNFFGNTNSVSQTFTFTNAGSGDYSLAVGDTGARDQGSLLADVVSGYTGDIVGTARDAVGAVDAGAFEFVVSGGGGFTVADTVLLRLMERGLQRGMVA